MNDFVRGLGKIVRRNHSYRPGVWQLSRSVCTDASLHLRRGLVFLASTPQFSQLLVTSDKLSKTAIHADQQASQCPNRGRHQVLRTGEVDVKFRLEHALIG